MSKEKAKITLGVLIRNQGALVTAYSMRLKNGAKAYRLLKALDKYNEELKTFDKIRVEAIKATGKEEILPHDKEYQEVIQKLNEAMEVEIPKVDPVLGEQDLEGVEIDAKTLKALEEVGILS